MPGEPTISTPLGIGRRVSGTSGIAEEIDDFKHLFLGFLDAGDVLEGDLVAVHGEQAGLALAEGHRAAAGGFHLLAEEEKQDADDQQEGQEGEERAAQVVLVALVARPCRPERVFSRSSPWIAVETATVKGRAPTTLPSADQFAD